MAKIEAPNAAKYQHALSNLGDEIAVLNQGLESLLQDPTVTKLNVVGNPERAIVVVAKRRELVGGHRQYSVFSPLPRSASQDLVLETYQQVFSDKTPGMPAKGKTPAVITTELSPSEGEWANPVNFVEAALNNGYSCTNEDKLMTSPAAEISIEHKPANEETKEKETTTLAIGIRSPKTINVQVQNEEIACNVADIVSLEISLDGNQFNRLRQHLEEKGIKWMMDDEGYAASYAADADFAAVVLSIAEDVRKEILPQAETSVDEQQIRMVATKTLLHP